MVNIPVAAKNNRVEERFKQEDDDDEVELELDAIDNKVVAVRVIVLIDVKNKVFHLSLCSPMLLCISTLSETDSKIAYIFSNATELS